MGNTLSPVVANIYMKHFEALAIESARLKPATWLRNVDGSLSLGMKEGTNCRTFSNTYTELDPSIQFTMELEENRKLPFLDVLVTRGTDKLTTVYRRASHTDWYIHFTSNHHNRVKQGVIKCLKWRATRICETEDLETESPLLPDDIPDEGLPREVHHKCNGAEN